MANVNRPLHRDIVVIAASAGGIEALRELLSALPEDVAAALLIVLHIPATSGGALASILDRSGPLAAATARDGDVLRHGRVYVAPPDRHLLVAGNRAQLSRGPRQNGHRPAADPLFTSAAAAAGPRVMGVVLSGTLDDGAVGAAMIERRGGMVAVQDPATSAYAGMPRAALAATARARVLPVREIAALIVRQSHEVVGTEPDPEAAGDPGAAAVAGVAGVAGDRGHVGGVADDALRAAADPPGEWSGLTCPECGGPLHYSAATEPGRYECRLGHGWSPASLLDGHSLAVEQALWAAALRLDERVRLSTNLAEAAEKRSHLLSAQRFGEAARESADALVTIRALLERTPLSHQPDEAN